jgi:flagellar hook-length control protein FliK
LETSPKPTIEVSASVIPGAMAKPRLSTEALMGISSGIQNLTPQGGGEMKIRLKPDHLGELSVRVMTHGNHVGLQIQASDDKAKKILEESISHLKESLSAQNLTLGQLDVTVAPQIQNSNGSDLGNSSNHSQNFSGFQGDFGQSMNQQQGWQGSGQGSENQTNSQWNQRASGGLASNRSWVGSSPSQNQTGSSRLDVRA